MKLTLLDMENAYLQIVEPMTEDHPLKLCIEKNGSGLHHICLRMENIDTAVNKRPVPTLGSPHEATQGKLPIFVDRSATQDTQVEYTGS